MAPVIAVNVDGATQGTLIGSGGSEYLKGGIASGTRILNGGAVFIDSGSTSGAVVGSGGLLILSSAGLAVDAKVLKGGRLRYAGGDATGLILLSGAQEEIARRARVDGLTIGKGVTLVVSSGGRANNTTLRGGTEIVASGGIIGGAVTFGKNATLTLSGAANMTVRISGFVATDTLDLADYAGNGTKLAFFENKAKTRGTLTITSGKLTATIRLFGQYVAAGFHLASDGAAGTAITYSTSSQSAHGDLAPNQG